MSDGIADGKLRGESLEARMASVRDTLSEQTEEVFPLPGKWGQVVGARLTVLSWRKRRQIGEAHAKVKDPATQDLYVAADILLAATSGFVMIQEDGSRTDLGTEETWETLAQRGLADEDLPDDLTPRRAMIALLGPERIPDWFGEYMTWVQSARIDSDQEVRADFDLTG